MKQKNELRYSYNLHKMKNMSTVRIKNNVKQKKKKLMSSL